MGVPSGGGNLGQASGSIVINTQQLTAAQAAVQAASRQMTQALNAINAPVTQAQSNVTNLSSGLQQLGGAFGLAFGAAGLAQAVRFATALDEIATAYRRQSVAARNLAGSQGQLNDLLRVYDRASGGVIDKAQALSDVTRLMAVGFADSTAELDSFVRAVRGISIATGRPQEFVVTQLQLELLNQTGLRLDQVGLGMEEVRKRAEALQAANSQLTREQAYQAAVLETANSKYRALTTSAEAQATGIEKLRKAWRDFQLETGQNTSGGVNAFAEGASRELNALSDNIEGLIEDIDRLKEAINQLNGGSGRPTTGLSGFLSNAIVNWFTGDPISDLIDEINRLTGLGNQPDFVPTRAGQHRQLAGPATAGGFSPEQRAVIREREDALNALAEQAGRDRLDATRQYEEQRTATIRQYELTIAREAQDFAIARLRAEQDFQRSVARMQRDAAQREERAAQDLARTMGRALADTDEQIADLREDAYKRLTEIDEDFKKNQARREQDFRDDQLSAAGRLDAIALLELRKDRARQLQDAKEAHDEQRRDLQEQLDERIADEREALEQRRLDALDAYNRQLEEARAADQQRLEDMQADFNLRKEREDEDRGLRLERMAEDHRLQLEEFARQHEARIAQIIDQEARQRAELEEQFNVALNEAKVRNDAWIAEDNRRTDAAVANWQRAQEAAANTAAAAAMMLGGSGVSFPSLANPNLNLVRPIPGPATNTNNSRVSSVVVQPGAIQVFGAIGQNPRDIAHEVRTEVRRLLEEVAGIR